MAEEGDIMSNPNTTTMLYERDTPERVAQHAGEEVLAAAVYVEPVIVPEVKEPRMTDRLAMDGDHPTWLGFDSSGKVKLDYAARVKQREEDRQAQLGS